MTPAITLEELLAWNEEASNFWKAHLDANPALLALPCGIGGAAMCRSLSATSGEWNCAGASASPACPMLTREDVPAGPLDALFGLHLKAVEIFRAPPGRPGHELE